MNNNESKQYDVQFNQFSSTKQITNESTFNSTELKQLLKQQKNELKQKLREQKMELKQKLSGVVNNQNEVTQDENNPESLTEFKQELDHKLKSDLNEMSDKLQEDLGEMETALSNKLKEIDKAFREGFKSPIKEDISNQ